MYKELKCSLLKSLYFVDEDSEAQITKEYTQIYPKILTKFGRAANQFIILSFFHLAKSLNLLYFFAQKQQSVFTAHRYLK